MKLPLRSSIARISALNLAGAVTPAMLGILLLPAITSGLGLERFGLLSLALVTLEYASLFALGLGPATTRYVAEDVARGGETSLSLIRWSVLAQIGLGGVGAVVLFVLAPVIATRAFNLTGELAADGITAFRLVGLLLPVTLVFTNLVGALEGARRFGYSNSLRIPAASATFLIPATVLLWSRSVPVIIASLVVVRLLLIVVAWLLVRRTLPGTAPPLGPGALRELFTFGAWLSVSNFASPVLVYGERYMLVARSGVAAAGLYSAPLDALLRVLLLPGSLVRTLFPVLTAAQARGDLRELRRLFTAAVNWLAVLVGPPLVVVAFTAPTLLRMWLGPTFADGAGDATRILALGVLLNSMAQVPANFLIATGKPHIPARFHVAELVVYLPLAWWLVGEFGLMGAAAAWTLRVAVDAGLLYAGALRSLRRPAHE